jgi:hypothetical protein
MENRNGLVVGARVTQATGTAERDTALELVGDLEGNHRVTVAGDRGFDTKEFVACPTAWRRRQPPIGASRSRR